MENHFERRNKTRVPYISEEVNGRSKPQSRDGRNLGYNMKFENNDVSNTEFDSVIVENVKTIQQKQQADGKGKQNEELIRYMSKLPSFLEKGKNVQERAFTVGVLDWRLLEKWQRSHHIGNSNSPSSSNTSSFSSTEGSSSRSSRGHSLSPACQKIDRPTLHSHLYGSRDSDSSEGNDPILQNLEGGPPSVSSNIQEINWNKGSKGSEDCKGKMKIQDLVSLKHEDVVPVAPKVAFENRCSSKTEPFVLTEKNKRGFKETRRQSFSCFDNSEASFAELTRNDPRDSEIEKPCSSYADGRNVSVISSRGKKPQEKISITPSKKPIEIKSSERSNSGTVEATKGRNHSPIRRFSISLGRIGKISSSSVAPSVEKSSANEKRSSSPLRRLLDPLIKPKAVKSDNSTGASQSDSTSRDRSCKSSEGRAESAALHSVKMKLDLKHCKKIDAADPQFNKKSSSTVQALLQVALKNGVPLFTFAVDNKSDILAATMKKLCSSEKDEYSMMYTFFFVHETKKKNKDSGGGYVPNVVAQMKVADDLTEQNSRDQAILKEFVLFASDKRQADQKTTDVDLNDELAAIVVKIPKKTTMLPKENYDGLSTPTSKEPFQHVRASYDQLSMTVIFPGGNHGVPIKGGPSSLIKRWKTGGLCDCGGWDLGCQLRVMANDEKGCQGSNSTKPELAGRFELFSQGEEVDHKPVFSLAPFKDGIFSVEFDSSIKVLQAFSISLAVLRCRKPTELSETSDLLEDRRFEDGTVSEADSSSTKVCNREQVDSPVKYVSRPPLSPVGRV